MRALTIKPGEAGSAKVSDCPDPRPVDGELLVEGLALGICGTDREIAQGQFGWAPPGSDRLILGHESLGKVSHAPPGTDFAAGDLVVGVVRHPDPQPCGACAHGEFDMCRNGQYTEHGIKQLHGFGSQLWTVDAEYAVKLPSELASVGVLMEPTTVVAKAWEQIERVGARAWFEPRRVLVTGAGPIGLLAALLGAQRGLDVHVLDRAAGGPKAEAVAALGATYHCRPAGEVAEELKPDVVVEATGASEVIVEVLSGTAAYGIVCLTGVSAGGRNLRVDVGAANRAIVLENDVIIGSVNANLRHYRQAVAALSRADTGWLEQLITRRLPPDQFAAALKAGPDDIKVVLTL
jgi:threonine dehydrogenase-like Zn-dependent dehydrogenase